MAGGDPALVRRTPRESERPERRFAGAGYSEAATMGNSAWSVLGSRVQELEDKEADKKDPEAEAQPRSMAQKIYEAAVSGKGNPIAELRQPSKVPYGYLAKDGIIEYNGVCFVCDERTNSICLGDMTDEKQVLNIPLSGGGQLKVNRANIGQLSDAIGMFCPEDVNRILRAIAQDNKIQAMKEEIKDEEASVGGQLAEGGRTEETRKAEES